MFKAARWKSERNKIKAVFKFQFQATQVFACLDSQIAEKNEFWLKKRDDLTGNGRHCLVFAAGSSAGMGGARGFSVSAGRRKTDGEIGERGGCRRIVQLGDSNLRNCEADPGFEDRKVQWQNLPLCSLGCRMKPIGFPSICYLILPLFSKWDWFDVILAGFGEIRGSRGDRR